MEKNEILIEMWDNLMDVKHDSEKWKLWQPNQQQLEFALNNGWRVFFANVKFPCSFIEFMATHLYHGGNPEVYKNADKVVMAMLG